MREIEKKRICLTENLTYFIVLKYEQINFQQQTHFKPQNHCVSVILIIFYSSKANRSDLKRKHSISSAERRAEHNAIERARRECLNSKFQKLADALPNLRSHRRPSKGQIVEKALDWVKQNMTMESRYQYQIMQLQNENKRLINQITITQEKDSINNSIDPSPLYIPVDYTNTHCHPLQQQAPLPFDNCSSMPVSPVSSNGSNFPTGEHLSMAQNQVNGTIIEYDVALTAATDEDDSDIKSNDENFNDFNDANYCFFEYQNIKSPTFNEGHHDQHQFGIKQSMIEPESISYPTSFIE
ncbi:hypothetical protein K501DRAFT_334237 [Backusella circina FSU 941]|nr:hypothetical protein K501DRAFT_334237 [Backusella circina FSU 941]